MKIICLYIYTVLLVIMFRTARYVGHPCQKCGRTKRKRLRIGIQQI
jgi:hypothetical protein